MNILCDIVILKLYENETIEMNEINMHTENEAS